MTTALALGVLPVVCCCLTVGHVRQNPINCVLAIAVASLLGPLRKQACLFSNSVSRNQQLGRLKGNSESTSGDLLVSLPLTQPSKVTC